MPRTAGIRSTATAQQPVRPSPPPPPPPLRLPSPATALTPQCAGGRSRGAVRPGPADGSGVPPLGRFGLAAGALIVLTRPFFMSAIAYRFYQRSRHFCKQIEGHWMHGTPALDTIIAEIDAYDHGRALPPTTRGVLTGQVKSGPSLRPPCRS